MKTLINKGETLKDTDITGINQCGLLIQEIYADACDSSEPIPAYMDELLTKRNVFASSFILDRILTTMTGFSKDCEVPYIVKNNFPSKKHYQIS